MTDRYRATPLGDALETILLEDLAADAKAWVSPARGGMVTRFSTGGEEVLFLDEGTLNDPSKNVRGGVPVLFPISGKVTNDTLSVGGATYALKQHGFARNRRWVGRAETSIGGAVAECTLVAAPVPELYASGVTVTHRHVLADGVLTLEQTYVSPGDLRIQPGFHPYFLVPDATKREARVVTDATRGRDNVTGAPVVLSGPIDLTAKEVDLHLLDPKAKTTQLVRPGMRDVLLSTADDYTVTVVWTLAGRDFVCVEPWTAPANALNEGGGILLSAGRPYETWIRIALG